MAPKINPSVVIDYVYDQYEAKLRVNHTLLPLTRKFSSRLQAHSDIHQVRRLVDGLDGAVYVVALDETPEPSHLTPLHIPGLELKDGNLLILSAEVDIQRGDRTIRKVFFVKANNVGFALFWQQLSGLEDRFEMCGNDFAQARTGAHLATDSKKMDVEAKYYYVVCEVHQFPAVMKDGAIDNITKINTAFFLFMPMAFDYITSHFIPYHLTDHQLDTFRAILPENVKPEDIVYYACYALFRYAYSINEHYPKQACNRTKATAASCDMAPPTQADFDAIQQLSSLNYVDPPPPVLELIGRTLAIDKEFEYTVEVEDSELAEPEAVKTEFNMSPWQTAVYTQMRLIFQNYHSSTIKFAGSVIELVRNFCNKIGGKFQADFLAVSAITAEILTKQYTALARSVLITRQINSFARICYIGLLYHRKCLGSEDEKKQFSLYNIDGVASHVTPANDKKQCEAIVSVLPINNIVATATIAQFLGVQETVDILINFSPEEQDQIYTYLKSLPHPGEWANNRTLARKREVELQVRDHVERKLSQMEEEVQRELNTRITTSTHLENFAEISRQVMAIKDRITAAKASMRSISDIIPNIQHPESDEIKVAVLERSKVLFSILQHPNDITACNNQEQSIITQIQHLSLQIANRNLELAGAAGRDQPQDGDSDQGNPTHEREGDEQDGI